MSFIDGTKKCAAECEKNRKFYIIYKKMGTMHVRYMFIFKFIARGPGMCECVLE